MWSEQWYEGHRNVQVVVHSTKITRVPVLNGRNIYTKFQLDSTRRDVECLPGLQYLTSVDLHVTPP